MAIIRTQSNSIDVVTATTHYAFISPYDEELSQFPYVRIRNTVFKTQHHHQVHQGVICLNAPMRKTIQTLAPNNNYALDVQGLSANDISNLDEAQTVQVLLASLHLNTDYANLDPSEICREAKRIMLNVGVLRKGQFFGFKINDQIVWLSVVNVLNGSHPGSSDEYYTTYRIMGSTEVELMSD